MEQRVRIPQVEAKAAAMRIIQHRMMESAAGVEFELIQRLPAAYRESLPPIPDTARTRLWAALDGLCGICAKPIASLSEVTYDHVVPRARGGKNYGNLVPAHGACNQAKGDRMPRGCELIVLDTVNTKAGNVLSFEAAKGRTLAAAFEKAGLV